MSDNKLPVHGFVLAGGKSSRMGQDKALLPFCGVPLIEIAIAKLRAFCNDVSILGAREDLRKYASVVHDLRSDIGPGAAFESALRNATQPWAMFVPVDVPLVPAIVLEQWCRDVSASAVPCASFLITGREQQPAFSILHRTCAEPITRALDRGERKLVALLHAADTEGIAPVSRRDVRPYAMEATPSRIKFWFSNINTPQELTEAEAWAHAEGWQAPTLR